MEAMVTLVTDDRKRRLNEGGAAPISGSCDDPFTPTGSQAVPCGPNNASVPFTPFTPRRARHALAAAVRAHADLIVTYNKRHFPESALRPWEIEVQGPSGFLRGLYDLDAGLFVQKLHEQAAAIGFTPARLLRQLLTNVPKFAQYFCEDQGIDLSTE